MSLNFYLAILISVPLLNSCSPIWGDIGKDVEEIETQEAIKVVVDKEAIGKDTDVEISVKVTNKDTPTSG